MTARLDPGVVSPELVELTRRLGEPGRDLVILAEGNTSQRLDDDRIAVKASGARMRDAGKDDFVVLETAPLMQLVVSDHAGQDELTAALDAGTLDDGRRVRASIETLIHVAVQSVAPSGFVAHTHPTSVVGLLSGVYADEAFARAAYSDEAVVLGQPLFVPYATPGIDLGRAFHTRLRNYVERMGKLPRLVLLGNHGIVAIADTSAGVEAVSDMAVKAARVRIIASATGGLAPLTGESVGKFLSRQDVAERTANIAHGRF